MWFKKKKKKEHISQRFYKREIIIIDYLVEGVLFFDEDNRLSLANTQVEKFFGVKRDDLMGKTILELNRYLNFNNLISFLGTKIKNRERVKTELKIRGGLILEATVIPIISEEKKDGILIILRDITREKLIEKAKSEFIRLSTHQLWTPASAVKWSLQMILKGDVGELSKEQRELIEESYKANDREIKLIGDLLKVAQIEMGNYLSDMTLSDIGEIIQSLIKDHKEEAEKKGIKVEFKEFGQQLPKVMVDVAAIKNAIGNIIDNAIRYNSPKGIVRISLEKNEKEIQIQIFDNGLGIPQEEKEKVFTRFFRGSNIMQVDTVGTGLGLYMAKNIIEAHGGRIWFESEQGKGTSFYFTIPIKKEFGEFITNKFY